MSERQTEWRLSIVGVDGGKKRSRKRKRKREERLLTGKDSEGRNFLKGRKQIAE